MTATVLPTIEKIAQLLGGHVRSSREILCPGPNHSAADRSLSVKLDESAPDGFVAHSFSGDDPIACRDFVRKKLGLSPFKPTKKGGKPWKFVEEYIYRNETGEPFLRVCKCLDGNRKKQYPQWHWDGRQWVKGATKTKIPYRLPQLLAAPPTAPIYFVEGEKCADTLAKIDFIATTAAEGCEAAWDKALTPYFKDRVVFILVDADKGGRAHGQKVAKALDGVAASIKVIDLYSESDDGSDVADWLEGDPTGARLVRECKAAPLWEPSLASVEPETVAARTGGAAAVSILFKKQADALIELASGAVLFHTPDGNAYADVTVNGHRETYRVRSKKFKLWLGRRFYLAREGAPSSEAMNSALGVIEARAIFDGPEHKVNIRVGGRDGKFYIDLADDHWRTIEIDADGWRLIASPPVRFQRVFGMLPLPEPVPGGSIETLRPLLNVDRDGFVLIVAWLLAALRPNGPYPILNFVGEQGAAKSSVTELVRALVDPNTAMLRALPREDRDLFIAATNAHVQTFDNISTIPNWISDTLCRLATGGGFATRQLFTDDAEMLFDAMRPVILNGIEDVATRPDLVDRTLMMSLRNIENEKRREIAELKATFENDRAAILGSLFDAVAHGLSRIDQVNVSCLPRMADFFVWASACETAFWEAGTFARAYEANTNNAVSLTIEADLVASAVQTFMASHKVWEGKTSDLLGALSLFVTEQQRRSKGWPTQPNHLSGRLRRAAQSLRKVGILVTQDRDNKGSHIKITNTARAGSMGKSSSSSSPSSADNVHKDFGRDHQSGGDDQLLGRDDPVSGTVTSKSLKQKTSDDHDDHDDHYAALSEECRCAQCNGYDGTEQEYLIEGDRVWLHGECRRFYLAAYGEEAAP
jgi:hypothetical protein